MNLLTKDEHRFIREWKFQKQGSKAGFIILYTIVWTLIFHLTAFFLNMLISAFNSKLIETLIGFLAVFIIGFLITLVMFYRN